MEPLGEPRRMGSWLLRRPAAVAHLHRHPEVGEEPREMTSGGSHSPPCELQLEASIVEEEVRAPERPALSVAAGFRHRRPPGRGRRRKIVRG